MDIAWGPIFPENLEATKEELCEENPDMVFTWFRFIGECRVVASPEERRDRAGSSRARTTMASVTKDKQS